MRHWVCNGYNATHRKYRHEHVLVDWTRAEQKREQERQKRIRVMDDSPRASPMRAKPTMRRATIVVTPEGSERLLGSSAAGALAHAAQVLP